jgi:hypothetical protein
LAAADGWLVVFGHAVGELDAEVAQVAEIRGMSFFAGRDEFVNAAGLTAGNRVFIFRP